MLTSKQAEAGCLGDGGGAGGDAKLGEDVGHVAVDGVLAQDEAPGDLLVAHPLGHKPKDFQLPFGEAGRR